MMLAVNPDQIFSRNNSTARAEILNSLNSLIDRPGITEMRDSMREVAQKIAMNREGRGHTLREVLDGLDADERKLIVAALDARISGIQDQHRDRHSVREIDPMERGLTSMRQQISRSLS